MTDDLLKIAICEPSLIIRSGLSVAMKRISGFRVQSFEMATVDNLISQLKLYKPDILIINPVYWCRIDLMQMREETGLRSLKCIAVITSVMDENITKSFDESITLFDGPDVLQAKIEKLLEMETVEAHVEEAEVLSSREKEILACVVKGLTNKEIAQELFLSAHTVISHRRNIARKLEIHSTAGLTIYAIVNKLVTLEDVKSVIE